MYGDVDDTQLHGGMIYALAECPLCSARFAAAPNPFTPGQWAFYERDHEPPALSHICSGGLLCPQGHALVITLKQAVLTQAGEWLNVEVRGVQPALN